MNLFKVDENRIEQCACSLPTSGVIPPNTNKQGHSSRNLSSLRLHVCRITHLHYAGSGQSIAFLANRNAELAVPPLFWPVNGIKIGEHAGLMTDPTVSLLDCDYTNWRSDKCD